MTRAVARPITGEYRWLAAGSLMIAFAGSAPSGLYPLYQRSWSVSASMLTVVFSVFIAGIVLALTTLVPLSDRFGRRTLLAGALCCGVVAVVVYLLARGLGWLLPAGFLTGVAVGAYQGTVNAAFVDMLPPDLRDRAALASSRMGSVGLAGGPVTAGLLGQFAPAPLRLLYVLELAVLVPIVVAVLRMPEPSRPAASPAPRSAASVRRPRWLPALCAIGFVSFAAGSVINALGSSIFVSALGVDSLAAGGVVVALLFASAALAQPLVLRMPLVRAVRAGLVIATVGVAGTATAIVVESPLGLLAAAAVAGAGQGWSYAGSLALLNVRAAEDERGALTGRYYAVAYCGAAVPVLATGAAISWAGLTTAVLLFAACLGAASLLIAAWSGPVLSPHKTW